MYISFTQKEKLPYFQKNKFRRLSKIDKKKKIRSWDMGWEGLAAYWSCQHFS